MNILEKYTFVVSRRRNYDMGQNEMIRNYTRKINSDNYLKEALISITHQNNNNHSLYFIRNSRAMVILKSDD